MPDQKISQMTADTSLDGSEIVPVVQNGNKRTTAQAIANLAPGTSLSYDPATRLLSSSTGADVTLPEATAQASGLMGSALYSKLDSIVVNRAEITVVPVRNTTGSTIAKGTPVYVPTPGSSGTRLLVAPADASSEATAATTIGLALDAIAHNVDGYVITEGELTGVNTGSLTEGGLVFLSETTGAITSTRPIQPAHGVVLGYCIKQAAGAGGILYVKVDNGLELNELHDVLITSPAAGQVLRRASDGLWKNAQLSAADVGADPAGTAAAAVASHVAAADPHPGVYLTPSDIIAGSGVTVDTTTPGSATISATIFPGSKTVARFEARQGQPPAANFATVDTRNSVFVLEFDATIEESTIFLGQIPDGTILASGLLVRIWWMADTATTNNVRWGAQFERSGTDLDADSFDLLTEVTSAAPATSGIEAVAEITCTALDGLTAGDGFRLRIVRRAADVINDTMSGDAQLVRVEVRQVA